MREHSFLLLYLTVPINRYNFIFVESISMSFRCPVGYQGIRRRSKETGRKSGGIRRSYTGGGMISEIEDEGEGKGV